MNAPWIENRSPVFVWKFERAARPTDTTKGFRRLRPGVVLEAGYCRSREDARRKLDAKLLELAGPQQRTPGTAAFRGALAEGKVKEVDLLATFDLSDDEVLSFGADSTWSLSSFSEEYLGR